MAYLGETALKTTGMGVANVKLEERDKYVLVAVAKLRNRIIEAQKLAAELRERIRIVLRSEPPQGQSEAKSAPVAQTGVELADILDEDARMVEGVINLLDDALNRLEI